MILTLTIVVLILSSLICILRMLSLYRRQQSIRRIVEFSGSISSDTQNSFTERRSWVRRWLNLAGFRHSSATLVFLGLMVVSAWAALGFLFALHYVGMVEPVARSITVLPDEMGEGGVLVGYAIPWIVFCLIAGSPILVVRGIRKKRIADVEHDIPLLLDLLSTLAEAGMSFDLALAKILNAQPSHRPLTQEFRVFQREISIGISRINCFRRLSDRLSISSVSLFVSALIQSEQLGANIANTLRRQANDIRHRRQEKAMLHAQGLSVKLVFPLIICFLPGIFFATLGPTVYQLVKIVGGVVGGF